ncbi:MAG TPA: D-aminoacyl-tRNA deacylase [Tepidisphaeraceae bacterium]|jgi:D-tyrosyl-tRNA(Tyr) deacylase|nr:D-aminoacyl-tRNA deacylase [Tepidisphaeraceae bacterium]
MIAVIQRVSEAKVVVAGEVVGEIGLGLMVLAAVQRGDRREHLEWVARKLVGMRIFRNGEKYFDLDVTQVQGSVLLVSQFTLAADARQGRRPSLSGAEEPGVAQGMFEEFVGMVKALGVKVETGRFGAEMRVSLVNEGPATFLLNSREAVE